MSNDVNKNLSENAPDFRTLKLQKDAGVMFVEIDAPPMNLMGPELVSDLISLIQLAEADSDVQVIVFKSADPDYFVSHVDVTTVKANREAAMKLNGEASIGLVFHHLSKSRIVSIAQIEGRVRGIGSEFALACDMRFASLETAIFCQFESSFGVIPGAGGAQHLVRLMGRARALEVMLSAEDYNAELAERYGWINRAMPAGKLNEFVRSLAHRISMFPSAGRAIIKERVNAIGLVPVEDIRRDSDLFLKGATSKEFQNLTQLALKLGFQTRDGELNFGPMLADMTNTAIIIGK